jgi:Protein of unknown function (DUF3024)
MTAPPETDLARVFKYCQECVPVDLHDEIRVEAVVRGSSVTILDCRAPWHPDLTEWTKVRVAQLRHDVRTHRWSLYWADRNGRWHRYDDLPPGTITQVLHEIEKDPAGIFWG